jgi:electron transfer flavoprotein alpha subunit
MTILGWNHHGLGQLATIKELQRLVNIHKPKIHFISKTRQNKSYVERLGWRLGMPHFSICKGKGKDGVGACSLLG